MGTVGRLFEESKGKSMINLFVGDNTEYLANIAKEFDPCATLVDFSNYKQILNIHYTSGTIYTALADLPKIDDQNVLYDLMLKADKIFYRPPEIWSDKLDKFSWNNQQILSEYLLNNVNSRRHNVDGINKLFYSDSIKYLNLVNMRSTTSRCLWVSGCSVAQGIGVDINQRFSNLISDNIKIPLVSLAIEGSSLELQADQILRSDIQKDDIVIWGLTSELRLPTFEGELRPGQNLDDRMSETRLYKAITSVHQVINFCEKVSARLILFPAISTEHLRLMLANVKQYYDFPYQSKFVDLGTDNLHPGPKQHQLWANYCIDIIKQTQKAKV